jgi:hypothetical protein
MSEDIDRTDEDFQLKSGSTVCVVGGGPAGSFFTYFFLELAERLGVNVELDNIEAKDFLNLGPVGCNHCGGIISESLVQLLSAEGITLPSDVIRRGIDSYVMHTDDRNVKIETPLHEKRKLPYMRKELDLFLEVAGQWDLKQLNGIALISIFKIYVFRKVQMLSMTKLLR